MPRFLVFLAFLVTVVSLSAQSPVAKVSWSDRSGTTGHTIVVDGKSFGPYKDVYSITHSTSGTAVMFLVTKRDRVYVLAGGKETGPLPTGFEVDQSYISDDGKVWMLTATQYSEEEDGVNQTSLWVNGKAFGPYEYVEAIEYAETGGNWISSVRVAEEEYNVLLNGKTIGPFRSVQHVWMSADSKLWGYVSESEIDTSVVTQDKTYNEVVNYNVDMMYPREPHWALGIQTDDETELIWVDGRSYTGYLNFSGLYTTYSSRHWGFQADKMTETGDYPVVVIDGKEYVGEGLNTGYIGTTEMFTWSVRDGDKTTVQVLTLP